MDDSLKTHAIEYAKFRDVYQWREGQKMHLYHLKIGGMTTWYGASDDTIYEAFLKGEQLSNPLIDEMENKSD